MEDIRRVLVAVDLTEMDESLVSYIASFSNEIKLDKVYFFNVMKTLELPDEIASKYPDMVAPMDESIKTEIQYTIDEIAGNQLKADYEIIVTDGHTSEQILKWAKIKEVDMILLGRKSTLKGEGIVSGKVAKLSPCSVVMVPEELPKHLKRMVIPLDFSKTSKLAFEYGLYLASKIEGLHLICLNIYEVPSGYHYSGKSYEEFADIMKKNAEETFEKFVEDFDTKGVNIEAKFELNDNENIAEKIYHFSKENSATSIAIGSKGRTQAAALLLGSIAEKLIKMNSTIPLIIVKQRRHNMGFLEALLKI